jgi:DNA (cytosine-5)-methyltransferase 1
MVVQPYEVGNCLTARMHKGINSTLDEGQTPVISIHPHCIGRAPEAGPQGKEYLLDGSAYCMDSRGQPQAVVQPIPLNSMNCFRSPEADPTTGCGIGDAGEAMFTITKGQHHAVAAPPAMAVRRLTPVECERLQGFPDGYTNIPWRKKDESPDGPRYKALGNSWAVPVVRWIGERIAKAA